MDEENRLIQCVGCGVCWNPVGYVGDPEVCPHCNGIEPKSRWATPDMFPLYALSFCDENSVGRIRPETASEIDAALRPMRIRVERLFDLVSPGKAFDVREAAAFVADALHIKYQAALACPIGGYMMLASHHIRTNGLTLTDQEREAFDMLHTYTDVGSSESFGWNWGNDDTRWFIKQFEAELAASRDIEFAKAIADTDLSGSGSFNKPTAKPAFVHDGDKKAIKPTVPYSPAPAFVEDKWIYENIHKETCPDLQFAFADRWQSGKRNKKGLSRNQFKSRSDRYANYHGLPLRRFKSYCKCDDCKGVSDT